MRRMCSYYGNPHGWLVNCWTRDKVALAWGWRGLVEGVGWDSVQFGVVPNPIGQLRSAYCEAIGSESEYTSCHRR